MPESYVHRIGRTARAGAEGIAISLCGAEERSLLREIERLTRQTIPAEDRRLEMAIDETPVRPARPQGRRPGPAKNKRPHRGKSGGWNAKRKRGRPQHATAAASV